MVCLLLAAALVAAFLLLPAVWRPGPPAATAQEPPTVYFAPEQLTATAGSTVTLQVRVRRAVSLAAYQLAIEYNPNVLELSQIEVGDFLSLTGRPVMDFPPVFLAPGRVLYQAVSAPGAPGVSGDGLLAVVHWQALADGFSPVSLPEVLLVSAGAEETAIEGRGAVVVVGDAVDPTLGPAFLPLAYGGRRP